MDDALDLSDDNYLRNDEQEETNLLLEGNPPEEVDDNAPENPRPGTKKRLYSSCWKNFRIVGEKRTDGKHNVRCRFCPQNYFLNLHRSGTNTMLRHSKVCPNTPGSTPRSSGSRKFDMLVFRDMIAAAIIEHNLPYSFVEYKRIRLAFTYANPDIQYWSRNTAVSDVLKIFEKEKEKLKKTLAEIPNRVCLTTDVWRAITIEGYICLTAHYVDVDWILKTKIVSFSAFPPPHTGIAISMKIMEFLKEWGIEKKVFSLTVDNASSNDNMQVIVKRQIRKDLVCNGEFFHVRCSAHILNLIVQDGLSEISEALKKIRDTVRFIKGSESREQMFESCKETLGIQIKGGLVFDVSTRWNSTYLMLFRAIQFKNVLRNLAEVERSYTSCPSDLEWKKAEQICEFLSPFNEMTKLISGSSYPTANLYFNEVWKIECWLRENRYSEDEDIAKMVEAMRLKFQKYWEEYSEILAIAAVFDPRLKFSFLEYCFKMLDPFTYQAKIAHLRKKMYQLFGAYQISQRGIATSNVEASVDDIPSGYSGFYAFSQKTIASGKSPLDRYLDEPLMDILANKNLDVLAYWRDHSSRFKELSSMACDVLSIPITTVASESSFSIGSRVLNKYRSCLLPTNVQALICARNWLRGFQEIDDEFDFIIEEEIKKHEEVGQ